MGAGSLFYPITHLKGKGNNLWFDFLVALQYSQPLVLDKICFYVPDILPAPLITIMASPEANHIVFLIHFWI
jgi:hypothetical protein